MGIKLMDKQIDTFCDYLVDKYIDENETFPSYLWSSCNCNIWDERTTNARKLFHSAVGKYFYSPNPNIFDFLWNFKNGSTSINSVEKDKKIKNHKYKKQKNI